MKSGGVLKLFLLFLSFGFCGLLGCTESTETLPRESVYEKDSALLVRTSSKLANEIDIKKLYTVALAMQTNRTLSCNDFNNECTLFSDFLSQTIKFTAKGYLNPNERRELNQKALEIQTAVEEGKTKLHEKWAKAKPSEK